MISRYVISGLFACVSNLCYLLELTDSTDDLSSESSYNSHSSDFDDECGGNKSTCNDDDGRFDKKRTAHNTIKEVR